MFCSTGALGISWQNLNHPNLLLHNFYRFHVYFHVRIILHHLSISLPHEDSFSARLKYLTLKVHITVFLMTVVLMQVKHGLTEISFIRQNMVFMVMEKKQ